MKTAFLSTIARVAAAVAPAAARLAVFAAALIAGWHIAGIVQAAEIHRIVQKNRSFNFKRIHVAADDVVQFGNEDEFIHQVYVESPEFSFDTAESPPGNNLDIKFTVPGTFEVHCHIHPKMLLVVNVQ